MRTLMIILAVLGLLLAAAVAGGLWLLKDPNRFKPELEALIRDNAGLDVELDGDLGWQIWPPVVLKGESIRFADDSTEYALGSFGVRANLLPLLRGGDLEIAQLRIDDLLLRDKLTGERTRVDSIRLDDFVAGQPSPLSVSATLESDEGPDVQVQISGPLTLLLDEDRLTINPMAFNYDGIEGSCDVAASELTREPTLTSKATPDDLLPLDTFRAVDWQVTCNVPELLAGEQTLRNLKIESTNRSARNANVITIPDALGGAVTATVDIDTRNRPPVWNIKTDADDIQSQSLMDLVAPSLSWAAPLLAGGAFTLRGNTMEDLANSAQGKLGVTSTAGLIDISAIKEAVLGIATLAGRGEQVAAWQEQLAYTELDGSWIVDGTEQDLRFTIDNLKLAATGLLNAVTGAMDLRATVTIDKHPTLDVLKLSDDLYGLPIPLRCQGTMEEPSCGLDTAAAQATLRDYATGRARGEATVKLNEAIDEKVPEEYRESARGLLKGLGGLLGNGSADDAGQDELPADERRD